MKNIHHLSNDWLTHWPGPPTVIRTGSRVPCLNSSRPCTLLLHINLWDWLALYLTFLRQSHRLSMKCQGAYQAPFKLGTWNPFLMIEVIHVWSLGVQPVGPTSLISVNHVIITSNPKENEWCKIFFLTSNDLWTKASVIFMFIGPAVRFNNFNISAPKPPPVIGQHTVEVLKNMLGYQDNYIAELIKDKTVSQNEVQ